MSSSKDRKEHPHAKRRLVFDEPDKDDRKKLHQKDNDDNDEDVVLVPPSPQQQASRKAAVTPKKRKPNELAATMLVTPSPVALTGSKKESRSTKRARTTTTSKTTRESVPTYIHKNLDYQTQRGKKLNPKLLKTFQLVQDAFVIPDDLEQSRRYGPLSGSSYEERVISAYSNNLLTAKHPNNQDLLICSSCATTGHKRQDCPTLI